MAINNKVILTGNIGGEASTYEDKKKRPFVAFSLATRDSYKDANDEWQQKDTVWHSVLSYKPHLIEMMKSFKKGARLEIEGSISYKEVPHKIKGGKEIKLREATIMAWAVTPKPLAKRSRPIKNTVKPEPAQS